MEGAGQRAGETQAGGGGSGGRALGGIPLGRG